MSEYNTSSSCHSSQKSCRPIPTEVMYHIKPDTRISQSAWTGNCIELQHSDTTMDKKTQWISRKQRSWHTQKGIQYVSLWNRHISRELYLPISRLIMHSDNTLIVSTKIYKCWQSLFKKKGIQFAISVLLQCQRKRILSL